MTPTRTLHNLALFNEIRLGGNVYFATDENGYGRIFDDQFFLGLAIPKTMIHPTEYTVKLYGSLCPHNFRRRTYRSQKAANTALIRYAEKALQSIANTAVNQ